MGQADFFRARTFQKIVHELFRVGKVSQNTTQNAMFMSFSGYICRALGPIFHFSSLELKSEARRAELRLLYMRAMRASQDL